MVGSLGRRFEMTGLLVFCFLGSVASKTVIGLHPRRGV